MDIHMSERPFPGVGRQYELALCGERISVSRPAHRARHIAVLGEGAERTGFHLEPRHEQAVALAALLIGARVVMGTAGDD